MYVVSYNVIKLIVYKILSRCFLYFRLRKMKLAYICIRRILDRGLHSCLAVELNRQLAEQAGFL